MRIGVDARPLRENQTSGIPRYVHNMLESLAKIDTQNEYVLYAHKNFESNYGNQFSVKHGALTRYGSVWMQAELPGWLRRDHIDVFWGTQHILPLLASAAIKTVLTVHDLVHYVFPETMRPMNLLINKLIIPPSVRKADAIIADTQWTLDDVNRFIHPKNKIMEVIHLGVSPMFFPRDRQESKKNISNRFRISRPYLLTLGTFEPRKNIRRIFQAFGLIANKIPHDLVVVGQKGWKNKDTLQEISKEDISSRIHFLGYLEDEILPDIYSAAEVFIFPSLYEGFGLPPLESMACGTPVISSNVSSIPEVVGDGAHLVNPNKIEAIAESIIKVVENEHYRNELMGRGLQQAKKFSWGLAAQKLLKIIENVRS